MRRLLASASMVLALVAAPVAMAGNYRDGDVGVFTLRPDATVTALTALPDGTVVYAAQGTLWLLSPAGAERRLAVRGRASALAPGPGGRVLAASAGNATIQAIDPVTSDIRSFATVPLEADAGDDV